MTIRRLQQTKDGHWHNMEFTEKTRELKSKSDYIKNKVTGMIFKTNILYLGILDSVDNYIESTQEEYENYLKEMEEKYNAYRH